MNPLMHVKFTKQLTTDAGIRTHQPLLTLGSVAPDLSILGVISEKEAHTRGLEFLDYLHHNEPSLVPFGIGFVLHGEQPECLDYHTHSPSGYIDTKKEHVLALAQQHKINFEGLDQNMLAHTLTEFACDSLAEKPLARELHFAFKQAPLPKIAFHMAQFFKGDEQRLLKLLHFFKHYNFNKLRTMHGIAHTFQDFMIYQKFANRGILNTYKYLWARINPFKTHKIINLLKDVQLVVKEDCHKFLDKAQLRTYRNVVKKTLGEYV